MKRDKPKEETLQQRGLFSIFPETLAKSLKLCKRQFRYISSKTIYTYRITMQNLPDHSQISANARTRQETRLARWFWSFLLAFLPKNERCILPVQSTWLPDYPSTDYKIIQGFTAKISRYWLHNLPENNRWQTTQLFVISLHLLARWQTTQALSPCLKLFGIPCSLPRQQKTG